jgi:peptidoglycan L-alanyl-D-glutamate endopeptidase CwlK
MGSRNINDLDPMILFLYHEFSRRMGEVKLSYAVTSTSRSVIEQMALYVQGRLSLSDVNIFRNVARLPLIAISGNVKVTWTLNSKHVTNMFDDDLNNNKARAFDIAIIGKQGQAVWDIKVSVNDNEIPDYDEAGAIGESVGLKWGGRFSQPDRPHFEI